MKRGEKEYVLGLNNVQLAEAIRLSIFSAKKGQAIKP